tara:strand:- start:353 stop:637 length:285 start_codon:yes stop_codon:yes gene_type:complete
MTFLDEQQFRNKDLENPVKEDNDLKEIVVEYVGGKMDPENGEVTLQMVIDVLADDFPELVFALAEENWLRGYEQGLEDVQTGWLAHQEENKNET